MLRPLAILLATASPSLGASWDYPYEVSSWQKAADVCGSGMSQSPIDLKTTTARQLNNLRVTEAGVEPTDFMVYGARSVGGHGLGFSVPSGRNLYLPDGSVYNLLQFHFHTGSEHTVDGKQFPAEVHYVHSRDGVEVDPINGDLAVVGINFELWDGEGVEPESVTALNKLFNAVGFTKDAKNEWDDNGRKKITVDFDATIFSELAASGDDDDGAAYWTYSGSLTTPPCSEIVRWHVMMKPLQISQAQVEFIESVTDTLGSFRPPQALNGRVVLPMEFVCGEENKRIVNFSGTIKKGRMAYDDGSCECELLCTLEATAKAWTFKGTEKKRGRCDCYTEGVMKNAKQRSKKEKKQKYVFSGLLD